jgi:hypothetical protein
MRSDASDLLQVFVCLISCISTGDISLDVIIIVFNFFLQHPFVTGGLEDVCQLNRAAPKVGYRN